MRNPRILILDEATSALTAADVRKVFSVLKRLRQEVTSNASLVLVNRFGL